MKPTSWNSIPRVFFRFTPMGKVEKTSFQRNWTTFVNPPFCTAFKSQAKMLVWNRPRGIQSWDPKGVFSFRPDGESRKNEFWTQLDDLRQPGFLRCWEKPTQNGGVKPTTWTRVLVYSVHRALYTVHCTLCNVQYTRYTVLCALCTIHGTLYSVCCALYTVHCTLCTVHYTRYTVLCALCTIHSTLYSALYTVHCTLCPVH